MSLDETILPRDLHLMPQDTHEEDWFEGDPMRTTYCDALSIFFPEGERFFIRSVKRYVNQIDDPKLREEVKLFCVQEAFHTREHENYNAKLAAYGYDVEKMEARAVAALEKAKGPLTQLAGTVAIEHLTATLSYLILSDSKLFENTSPHYRNLWTWHALEETEHKGVAFDVYKVVTQHLSPWKRYMLRCSVMLAVTVNLYRVLIKNYLEMMQYRNKPTGFRMWCKAFWLLFGNPGYYRRIIGYYLRFYLPGFHPWKHDDGKLVKTARSRLDAYLKPAGLKSENAG